MFLDYSLQNFKTHKDTGKFKLNGLTVLTGTNNSGKSSIIQSLRLLSLLKESSVTGYSRLPFEKVYGLKSFKDTLNKMVNPSEALQFCFTCDLEGFDYCNIVLEFDSTTLHKYKEIKSKNEAILKRMEIVYKRLDEEAKRIWFEIEEDPEYLYYRVGGYWKDKFIKFNGFVPDFNFFDLKSNIQEKAFLEVTKDDALANIFKFLSSISKNKIKYLNANRMIKRLKDTETPSHYMEEHGENTAIIMDSLWHENVLGEDRTFEEIFNEWTMKILNTRFEIRRENSVPRIVAVENEYEFDLEQIGFGNTQILPLLVLVLSSSKDDLLLIETPEEQLHPKWRADLVDFFYFAAQKGIKIIVETHSIELINRMRLLVKGNENLKDFTSIYFLHKEDFETVANQIKIEDTGKLSNWPEDFLDKVTVEDTLKLLQP